MVNFNKVLKDYGFRTQAQYEAPIAVPRGETLLETMSRIEEELGIEDVDTAAIVEGAENE